MDDNKILKVILKTSKTFAVTVFGILPSTSWSFYSNSVVKFTLAMKEKAKLALALKVKAAKITTQIRAKVKATTALKARPPKIQAVTSAKIKTRLQMASHLVVAFKTKVRAKVSSSIIIKTCRFTIASKTGTYYRLSSFDSQTLSSLDVLQLGQMDFNETVY